MDQKGGSVESDKERPEGNQLLWLFSARRRGGPWRATSRARFCGDSGRRLAQERPHLARDERDKHQRRTVTRSARKENGLAVRRKDGPAVNGVAGGNPANALGAEGFGLHM